MARVFFRRVEVVGEERIPLAAPIIFAANHPNGLIDPLVVLCFAPRTISFLAKAPLFRMPFVGWLVRAFGSIPVYRRQDREATSQNQETFARARSVLGNGGSIAIFPEGTTHSEPRLLELKTGAARIALGSGMESGVSIVPAGLFYTEKQSFRSSAVLYFGDPIPVAAETLDESGEPRRESVEGLTMRIEGALRELTLEADSRAALHLVARASRIFSAGRGELADELELQKRFVDGYGRLRASDPVRLAALESRIERFAAELGTARLEPEELVPPTLAGSIRTILTLLILLPAAVAGGILHYPTYRLLGVTVKRFCREEEMAATMKTVGGLLLYPLTWIALSLVAGSRLGPSYGACVFLVLPLLGYVSLRVFEQLDDVIGRARALTWRVARKQAYGRLLDEQRSIRNALIALGEELQFAPM
ncbi:MAG: lysophospholipid acyltransferase family protein [Thermoanaerobaculia bacterium]